MNGRVWSHSAPLPQYSRVHTSGDPGKPRRLTHAVTDDQNRVRIDTTRPLPHAVAGFSPDTFGPVLRADAPAAEVINGRAGMVRSRSPRPAHHPWPFRC